MEKSLDLKTLSDEDIEVMVDEQGIYLNHFNKDGDEVGDLFNIGASFSSVKKYLGQSNIKINSSLRINPY